MIMECLAVMAAYGGFILACVGAAAIIRVLFPKWFEEAQDSE